MKILDTLSYLVGIAFMIWAGLLIAGKPVMPSDEVMSVVVPILCLVALILWLYPHRAELISIARDLAQRFCGRWQLHPAITAGVAAIYGVCFFGDFIFEPWASVAAWDWSKPIAWLAFTGLTCAALNSVREPSPSKP